MIGVVGIFRDVVSAEKAAGSLRSIGITDDKINLLSPGSTPAETTQVPTSDTERPGMGSAVGGLLGGAVGAAAGLSAGSAVASLFIPGVGPVIAIGIAAAGLLGVGGAVAGVAVGDELEHDTTEGLPEDELFLYEDALRSGHSVVVAFVDSDSQAAQVRETLRDAGAESLDAAREKWWIGLRSAEQEHYTSPQPDLAGEQSLADAETIYRRGFEAALQPSFRGRTYESVKDRFAPNYADVCENRLFIRGYNRGCEFNRKLQKQHQSPEPFVKRPPAA